METLIQEIRKTTIDNVETRLKKIDTIRHQKDERLKQVLNNLEKHLLVDFESKIREASVNGYDNTAIFRFSTKDVYEDYRLYFLLKGPLLDRRGDGVGLMFFYNKDIVPVMERIKTYLYPFVVYMRYDRYKKENLVIVSWKDDKSLNST